MRALLGIIGYLGGVFVAAFVIHEFAPFAEMSITLLVCAAIGIVVSYCAALVGRTLPIMPRTGRPPPTWIYLVNIVFWGGGVAALAGGTMYRHYHGELGVVNGTAAPVEIAFDQHVLGSIPPGSQGMFEIPTSGHELTATTAGKVVDHVAFMTDGEGRWIFDVGGSRCFLQGEVSYSSSPQINLFGGGSSPGLTHIGIGTAHLFRHDTDYLWAAPHEIKSKNKEATATVLYQGPCDDVPR